MLYNYYGKDDIENIILDIKNNCTKFNITNNKINGCIDNIYDKSIFDSNYIDTPIYLNKAKKLKDIIDINKY